MHIELFLRGGFVIFRNMKATCISKIDLGSGWAGNTLNTAIYRQGLVSRFGYQYAVFYTREKELVVVQRNIRKGKLKRKVIEAVSSLADAHLTASLGVDGTGCVHLSYYHHNTPLLYRRMHKPHDLESFGPREPMTGCFESRVCYPFFLHPAGEGEAFYFLYRNGGSGNGEVRLKRYDAARRFWRDDEQAIFSGMLHHPWTSNPYLQTPLLDAKGTIHLFTTWRAYSLGPNNRINNVNLDYARGEEGGRYWHTSRHQPLRRPVTQVASETAVAIPPGSNLMNQSGAALDRNGMPMTVYYADDIHGVPQYHIARLHDGAWQIVTLSARKEAFALEGGGTLQVPISRPEVVVLPDNRPLVLYRADATDQRLVAVLLNEATLAPQEEFILSDQVGFAEPVIDRMRWEKDGVLSLFVQYSEQPMNEGTPSDATAPMTIMDWSFA